MDTKTPQPMHESVFHLLSSRTEKKHALEKKHKKSPLGRIGSFLPQSEAAFTPCKGAGMTPAPASCAHRKTVPSKGNREQGFEKARYAPHALHHESVPKLRHAKGTASREWKTLHAVDGTKVREGFGSRRHTRCRKSLGKRDKHSVRESHWFPCASFLHQRFCRGQVKKNLFDNA